MIKHIAFSMGCVYLVFLISWFKNRSYWPPTRIVKIPNLLVMAGIWSIMPSLIKKLGIGILTKITNNFFISNIFFGYGILRKIGSSGMILGLGTLIFIYLSLIYIYSCYLKEQENELAALSREGGM